MVIISQKGVIQYVSEFPSLTVAKLWKITNTILLFYYYYFYLSPHTLSSQLLCKATVQDHQNVVQKNPIAFLKALEEIR